MKFFNFGKEAGAERVSVPVDTDRAYELALSNKEIHGALSAFVYMQKQITFGGSALNDQALLAERRQAVVAAFVAAGFTLEPVHAAHNAAVDNSVEELARLFQDEQQTA